MEDLRESDDSTFTGFLNACDVSMYIIYNDGQPWLGFRHEQYRSQHHASSCGCVCIRLERQSLMHDKVATPQATFHTLFRVNKEPTNPHIHPKLVSNPFTSPSFIPLIPNART